MGDGRTNESPPVFYRTSSLSGPLPKKSKTDIDFFPIMVGQLSDGGLVHKKRIECNCSDGGPVKRWQAVKVPYHNLEICYFVAWSEVKYERRSM